MGCRRIWGSRIWGRVRNGDTLTTSTVVKNGNTLTVSTIEQQVDSMNADKLNVT